MHSHIVDAFAEWVGRSAHFNAVPLLLEEGCQHVTAAQERCRQCIRPQEQPTLPIHLTRSASSRSSQLVCRVPPVPEAQEETAEQETPRINVTRPCRWQTKAQPTPGGGGGGGGSPPSLPECPGGANSDDYSTASESGAGCRCRRCQQTERRLAPVRLNLPIFCSTDANADVTYKIWHFDVQDGWTSMMKQVCALIFLVAYKGTPLNGLTHCQGA